MRISKRTQLEIGALMGVIGICVIVVAAMRFDAFHDSDQRFRKQFEPYLITHAMRNPNNSRDNIHMYLHRKAIYEFYPSGNRYSRCRDLVFCSSGGLTIVAMGVWVCLRARRRPEPPLP